MTQSPRELAAQKIQFRKQQEKLFKDFLGVLDSLDRACEHWQEASVNYSQQAKENRYPLQKEPSQQTSQLQNWWQRIRQWLDNYYAARPEKQRAADHATEMDEMAAILTSAHAGIAMIRQTMLDTLEQHQVVPLMTQSQPFDPSCMYALGQQPESHLPANTVVQEVVRGYLWQGRILREAQVIVAVPPSGN